MTSLWSNDYCGLCMIKQMDCVNLAITSSHFYNNYHLALTALSHGLNGYV